MTLEVGLDLARRPASLSAEVEAAWWRGLVRLAREAPDCVSVLARVSGRVIDRCGAARVEDFVAVGLKSGNDKAKRRAFFALETAEARRLLDRLAGAVTFGEVQRQLNAFATALWGTPYPLRELADERNDGKPRRAAFSSGIILLPDLHRGVPASVAAALYRASVAHASAHLALGAMPFEPRSLKAIQMTLVGLVEDARIEALAMRRLPGLRKLWAPFHTIEPSHLKTAPVILARLARALFDPDYVDHDGMVAKGRALFAGEPTLDDPGLSRRIGNLLGNDIGQMRIQFDAKQFIIEPPYRDDNLGLWALPPRPPDEPLQSVDVDVQAVRLERQPAGRHGRGWTAGRSAVCPRFGHNPLRSAQSISAVPAEDGRSSSKRTTAPRRGPRPKKAARPDPGSNGVFRMNAAARGARRGSVRTPASPRRLRVCAAPVRCPSS